MVSLLDTQQQLRQPLGDGDIISSPGGWQNDTHNSCHLRVQQADHATFSNSQLLGAESIM
jgi:hypothetical protein